MVGHKGVQKWKGELDGYKKYIQKEAEAAYGLHI